MFSILGDRKDLYFYIILFVGLLFLFLVKSILSPFIISIIIAFLFKNLVEKLEKMGINRGFTSMFCVIVSSLLIVLSMLFIIPIIFTQSVSLLKELINYFNTLDINKLLDIINNIDIIKNNINVENNINLVYQHGIKYLGNISNFLISKSFHIVSFTFNLFVIPVITFYFLKDWNIILSSIEKTLPEKHKNKIIDLSNRINDVLEGYLVGQFSVCLILGSYYSILLYIFGLKYGLLIGILSSFLTIIPYFGAFIGCTIAIAALVFQNNGLNIPNIIIVLSIFISGQFIEGNFITPKLIGDKVNLHPIWIIFALFAGGCLAGTIGMFIALPTAGIIGTIIRFFFNNNELNKENDR